MYDFILFIYIYIYVKHTSYIVRIRLFFFFCFKNSISCFLIYSMTLFPLQEHVSHSSCSSVSSSSSSYLFPLPWPSERWSCFCLWG